jgi:hypothetical protein
MKIKQSVKTALHISLKIGFVYFLFADKITMWLKINTLISLAYPERRYADCDCHYSNSKCSNICYISPFIVDGLRLCLWTEAIFGPIVHHLAGTTWAWKAMVECYRRGKLLIRPPEIFVNFTGSHLVAKEEKLAKEMINFYLTKYLFYASKDLLTSPTTLPWQRRLLPEQ